MAGNRFDEPSGYDDALYRALGLVVRQLHRRGLIDAPALTREMRLLADQLAEPEASRDCIDGLRGIARSFEREFPQWRVAHHVR